MKKDKYVSALILAGGKSSRANTNKMMLTVKNNKLIQHVYDQIKPLFNEILISANNPEDYLFLGEKIIPDLKKGYGPLMGILSGLKSSSHRKMFVVAGDVPQINQEVIKQMLELAEDYDLVIPSFESSRYEPLFAVYTTNIVKDIEEMLDSGDRKAINILDRVNHFILPIEDSNWYWNINTIEDYEKFLTSQSAN